MPATIVDWAKILQSCSSQWELAISNPELIKYLITESEKTVCLPAPKNVSIFRKKLEVMLYKKGYSGKMLKLHEAIHLSRALPYVSEEKYLATYVAYRIMTLLDFND